METGIEQALLSKYENAERVPPTETLVKLADYYMSVWIIFSAAQTIHKSTNKQTDRRRYGGPFYVLGPIHALSSVSFPSIFPRKHDLWNTGRTVLFLGLSPKNRDFFRHLFRLFFRIQKFCFLSRQIVKKI